MTVHAPADGLVYFGRSEFGQWMSAVATSQKLRPGGVIAPDEVFITIVSPQPLEIRATVDEKDLYSLIQPKNVTGVAIPTFDADRRLPARLTRLSTVPREPGKFEVMISIDPGHDPATIKPGMTASVKLVTYRKDDALVVPSSAVFEEGSAESPTYVVYLGKADKDVKYPKRTVQVGKKVGAKTEILAGLAAGDEILATKP